MVNYFKFLSVDFFKSCERQFCEQGHFNKDVCNPITAEFREKLYGEIERAYQEAKEKQKEETKNANSQDKSNDKDEKKDGQAIGSGESLPFR